MPSQLAGQGAIGGRLALGIEELGRDVAGEVKSDWMVPLLVEEAGDRLMAWQ